MFKMVDDQPELVMNEPELFYWSLVVPRGCLSYLTFVFGKLGITYVVSHNIACNNVGTLRQHSQTFPPIFSLIQSLDKPW